MGRPRRVGVVGYGALGAYLCGRLLDDALSGRFELAFVWNRTTERVLGGPPAVAAACLADLADFASRQADVIIEVSHPRIIADWGVRFLEQADLVVGSPTALADAALAETLRAAAMRGPHGLYVPAGALWGAHDLKRMADTGEE